MSDQQCGANYFGCTNPAVWKVYLNGEEDYSVFALCEIHKQEDERHGGGFWSNQYDARGTTSYRRITQ